MQPSLVHTFHFLTPKFMRTVCNKLVKLIAYLLLQTFS